MGVSRVVAVVVAVAGAASLALAAGCDTTDDDPREGEGREAAVYELVLGWVLAAEPEPDDGEQTIFVASRHEAPIAVDVQVLLVEAMEERGDVRFIDERAEAVDDGPDHHPVRDGGVLVGLGAVPPDGDRIDVYVDRYRELDDAAAWDVTVTRSGDRWELAGDPVPVDPRPVPDDG